MADSATQTIGGRIKRKEEESEEMMIVWPDIVRDITDVAKNLNIPDVAKWLEELLQYNVPDGTKIRGTALLYIYKSLIPNDQITEDNIYLARILSWCTELMHASLLVVDDLMDESLVRRGKSCWYRYNDIGERAANDGLLLESAIFYILQKHFKSKDYYVNLLEIFHEAMFKTLIGQCLDVLSTNFNKKSNLNLFTMNRFNGIVEYKTSYYSTLLPVTAAMLLAGRGPKMTKQVKTILFEIGRLYQIQDDYLGCFGDSKTCGKDSTDIIEGKCTWLVVGALERATPEQRKILEECYSCSDSEKVKRVIQLFTDLDLPNIYALYEKETCNLLNAQIQQISWLPHNVFSYLLKEYYHRVNHYYG